MNLERILNVKGADTKVFFSRKWLSLYQEFNFLCDLGKAKRFVRGFNWFSDKT